MSIILFQIYGQSWQRTIAHFAITHTPWTELYYVEELQKGLGRTTQYCSPVLDMLWEQARTRRLEQCTSLPFHPTCHGRRSGPKKTYIYEDAKEGLNNHSLSVAIIGLWGEINAATSIIMVHTEKQANKTLSSCVCPGREHSPRTL